MDPNEFTHKYLPDYVNRRLDLLGRRKKTLERQVAYLQAKRRGGERVENYLSKIRQLRRGLKRINLEIKFTNTKTEKENKDRKLK